MKALAFLLAIGAAVGGLAVTAGGGQASPTTHDTLPVAIPPPGAGRAEVGVDFFWQAAAPSRTPVQQLHVFRLPARTEDLPPQPVQLLMGHLGDSPAGAPLLRQTRLVVDEPALQIFATPTTNGGVCTFDARGGGGCTRALLHGVDLHVDPGRRGHPGDVWGLAADDVAAVVVENTGGVQRARPARNAFYVRLPPGVVTPRAIDVHDRGGALHVFTIERCVVSALTPPLGC